MNVSSLFAVSYDSIVCTFEISYVGGLSELFCVQPCSAFEHWVFSGQARITLESEFTTNVNIGISELFCGGVDDGLCVMVLFEIIETFLCLLLRYKYPIKNIVNKNVVETKQIEIIPDTCISVGLEDVDSV